MKASKVGEDKKITLPPTNIMQFMDKKDD